MKKDEVLRQLAENLLETLSHVLRAYKGMKEGLWEFAWEEILEANRYFYRLADLIDENREKPYRLNQP